MVLWKSYSEEENTLESTLTMLHLYKRISNFNHHYFDKLTVISLLIDSILPTIRPIVKPIEASSIKQKRGQLAKANNTTKCAKKI